MTTAHLCVLFAGLMPFIFGGIAKSSTQGYDNRAPREFLAALQGWGQRANWAQLNSLEAFPLFAVAVIIAQLRDMDQSLLNNLAMGFIVARIAYGAFYILDKPSLRSLSWTAGIGCCLALFLI